MGDVAERPPAFGPELILALAGAVGTDLNQVTAALTASLASVRYEAEEIGLSELLDLVDWSTVTDPPEIDDSTIDRHIETRMEAGDRLREALDRGDALALLAILRISKLRPTALEPRPRHAYILRSLKHPDEVETLREVYGPHFFLISAYSPVDARAARLTRRIEKDWERQAKAGAEGSAEGKAWDLIERDRLETERPLGQQLGATFPKADLFVDARHRKTLEGEVQRLIDTPSTRRPPTRTRCSTRKRRLYGRLHQVARSGRSSLRQPARSSQSGRMRFPRQVAVSIGRVIARITAITTATTPM